MHRNIRFRRPRSGGTEIAFPKYFSDSTFLSLSDPAFRSSLIFISISAFRFETDVLCFDASAGAEMNGIQNRKACNLEKPFPGCMGRIVNLFDLSADMAGNRLLTEKAHRDGSLHRRCRSDVTKMLNPIRDQIGNKPIGSEVRRTSNKKLNGTPMKMLIAQEMSKETVSKHKSPNVIAKLMGLDALPGQQPDSDTQRSLKKGDSRGTLTQPGSPLRYWQQQNGFPNKQMQREVHPYQEQKEYKDVYEVWQQSPKTNYIKDKSSQKGRYNENPNEKRMALVRQKFIEAKRLATDDKLRQSKEFQDALEILSSNKDLFLKFLQEPNSMFSQDLCELQSIPPPPQTKCITVLRPSKTMDNNRFDVLEKMSEKQIKKLAEVKGNGWNENKPGWDPFFTSQKADNSAQPTRIVVLKPSPGKTHDIEAVVSSPPSSPRLLHNKDFCGEPEDDEVRESRDVAKQIMRQMRENLSTERRDETLLSSVFSNGYVGDESSFNRSEKEYTEEGNLSDSEVMTPTSRHSWDYINRFGSPYSSSSFSHASYSPESSVCREAKKRLSERWAMMASNSSGQERRQARRRSSTLGEMLALSDAKKSVRSGEEGGDGGLSILSRKSCGGEQDSGGTTSDLMSRNKDDGGEDSPINLQRSRSVPVSSTAYGASLNVKVPDPEVGKSVVPKDVMKPKSGKLSFKGTVSSLFFSRNNKPRKEKSGLSPLPSSKDESQLTMTEISGGPKQLSFGKISDDIPQGVNDRGIRMDLLPSLEGTSKTSSPASICVGPKQGTISREAGLSLAKPETPGNPNENLDEPSPISVLEAPFEEDIITTRQSSGNLESDHQGTLVNLYPLKSNLIDKSPPIESIARTLSWDDAASESATLNSLNPEAEEHEWFLLVKTLLSAAGLDGEDGSDAVFSRWHSSESPLDPSLIESCIDLKDTKELINEAKRREWRSNQRLLFDCVNAAVMDITGYGSDVSPCMRGSDGALDGLSVDAPVTVGQVWDQMKEWFSGEAMCFSVESGDHSSLVVDRVVRKEVVGKGWVELLRLEVDCIEKEIEGKLLEELVEAAVVEFTGDL
ncbi:hypothetical protein HHK36_012974 [Tetracentron sinense]|uniref:DUF4378 domain-containing protein n=1 Tax=Tetracentron sinense TaxID=13715 RepID=A0A834ZBC4_TETSI|nr:hypothetical protein HHK36_012974 [Tetracentron sinense]